MISKVKQSSNGAVQADYKSLADGTKLEVTGSDGKGYAYLGSLVYSKNGSTYRIESAGFSGGRIQASETGTLTYTPNYQITDHLGSVRVVFKDKSASGLIARNDYYAFGKKHNNSLLAAASNNANRWLYNGKEAQTTGSVGFLDYGARMYDNEIGRWWSVDPLAEKYTWLTPYDHVGGNPIIRIDPNGMDWIYHNTTFEYEWNDYAKGIDSTPDGYFYIGANDYDIIHHLNTFAEYYDLYSMARAIYYDQVDNGAANIITIGYKANTQKGSLGVYVVRKRGKVTETNKNGIYFDGVIFVGTKSKTEEQWAYNGWGEYLTVYYGQNAYKTPINGDFSQFNPQGVLSKRGYIYFSAEMINPYDQFTKAIMSSPQIPGQNVFHLKNKGEFIWQLQIQSTFRPSRP